MAFILNCGYCREAISKNQARKCISGCHSKPIHWGCESCTNRAYYGTELCFACMNITRENYLDIEIPKSEQEKLTIFFKTRFDDYIPPDSYRLRMINGVWTKIRPPVEVQINSVSSTISTFCDINDEETDQILNQIGPLSVTNELDGNCHIESSPTNDCLIGIDTIRSTIESHLDMDTPDIMNVNVLSKQIANEVFVLQQQQEMSIHRETSILLEGSSEHLQQSNFQQMAETSSSIEMADGNQEFLAKLLGKNANDLEKEDIEKLLEFDEQNAAAGIPTRYLHYEFKKESFDLVMFDATGSGNAKLAKPSRFLICTFPKCFSLHTYSVCGGNLG